jgi:hypothetical protein
LEVFDRAVPQSKGPIDLGHVRCFVQYASRTIFSQNVPRWRRFVVSGGPKTTNLVESKCAGFVNITATRCAHARREHDTWDKNRKRTIARGRDLRLQKPRL